MRWIIIGAGAVGATIGARLAQSGGDVVLVARGQHAAVMAERGLTFRTPSGTDVLRLPVVHGPGDGSRSSVELARGDVLVLAMKTQHTASAVRDWALAPVAGGGTAGQRLPVLCAQNGLENERLAARWFDVVLGACLWLPATHLSPGEVVAAAAPLSGMLQVGRYPGGDSTGGGTLDPVAARVAEGLSGDRLTATARADVMRWKRGKLLTNLVNGLDGAVAGPHEGWRDLADAVVAEGRAVFSALGLAVTTHAEEEAARGDLVTTREVPGAPRGGSSTWQSLARGQDTEVEYLNGEVTMLGRRAGVPTPVSAAVTRLVTLGQRDGRRPRWLDADAVRAEAAAG